MTIFWVVPLRRPGLSRHGYGRNASRSLPHLSNKRKPRRGGSEVELGLQARRSRRELVVDGLFLQVLFFFLFQPALDLLQLPLLLSVFAVGDGVCGQQPCPQEAPQGDEVVAVAPGVDQLLGGQGALTPVACLPRKENGGGITEGGGCNK